MTPPPSSPDQISIDGYVADGFGPVADTFRANFAERGETGAACAVLLEGKVVVDIFGGHSAPDRSWNSNTRSVVFSASKGITTVLVLMAVEAGLLDLDHPVAEYWPEFAVHGKDRLSVRELLAHRAGLIGLETAVTPQQLRQWFPVVNALAAQQPRWQPGTAHEYHALTFGYLAGEVLRRSSGRRPSEWLATEVADPLGLLMTYGDDPGNQDRALIRRPASHGDGIPLSDLQETMMAQVFFSDVYGSSDIFEGSNTPLFLTAESPAGNIVTRARDLARFYSATVTTTDGVSLLETGTVRDAAEPVSFGKPVHGPDVGSVWGTGFMVHSPRRPMAGPGSFGHDGAGGQLAFAHPDLNLGFGFQTASPGGDLDERADRLCAALLSCL